MKQLDLFGPSSPIRREPFVVPPSSNGTTSREAAEAVKPSRASEARDAIVAFLRKTGGATDQEMQDNLEMSGDSHRPRRYELSKPKDGEPRIRDSGCTRQTRGGNPAIVWIIAK